MNSVLSTMQPTDLAQLSKISRELKRRKTEERLRYIQLAHPGMENKGFPDIPVNDQRGFYLDPSDIRALLGGNRAMKTESGAIDVLNFGFGSHPVRSNHRQPPVHTRICAPKYEDGCKGVILKKFRSMIPHYRLSGSSWIKAWSEKSKTLRLDNGSTFNFKSYEQDVNTYGGDDLDCFWMDEHGEWKFFRENMARLADRKGYGMLTMTPEAGQTWEMDFILNPPEGISVSHRFFDTRGNPFLSPDGVKQLMSTLQDKRYFKAKIQGQFVALTGMVYDNYKSSDLIIADSDIPKSWYRVCVIDPHLRKFTAILWVAFGPDGEVVLYRARKVKMEVPELAKFLRVESATEKIDMWIGDEAQGGEGTNINGDESVLVQLQNEGIPILGTNQSSTKAFEAGVMKVRDLIAPDVNGRTALKIFESLNTPVEHIDNKLTGSIFWEFGRYRFKKEQKSDEETFREKVATVDDDYLDCLRYAAMCGGYFGSEPVKIVSTGKTDPITGW